MNAWGWAAVALAGDVAFCILLARCLRVTRRPYPQPPPEPGDMDEFLRRTTADPSYWEQLEREVRGQP